MSLHYGKNEIRSAMEDYLSRFGNAQRFEMLDGWESSFVVMESGAKERRTAKDQTIISECKPEEWTRRPSDTEIEEREKDQRQGRF